MVEACSTPLSTSTSWCAGDQREGSGYGPPRSWPLPAQRRGCTLEQGNPNLALVFGERALAIREKTLGQEHPLVAYTVNNLAVVHGALGDSVQALSLHQRALYIRRNTLGPKSAETAASLSNIAVS